MFPILLENHMNRSLSLGFVPLALLGITLIFASCGKDEERSEGTESSDISKTTQPSSVAESIVEPEKWVSVTAGQRHTCGVTDSGRLHCWGKKGYFPEDPWPIQEMRIKHASAGHHNCVITKEGYTGGVQLNKLNPDEGSILCWGDRSSLWSRDSKDSSWISQPYPPNRANNISVGGYSPNGYYACAVMVDGRVRCWGDDAPVVAKAPKGSNFVQVSVGLLHACAIDHDGRVVCWGKNKYGQTKAPSGRFSQISAGKNHTCGVRVGVGGMKGGIIECWGSKAYGVSQVPSRFESTHFVPARIWSDKTKKWIWTADITDPALFSAVSSGETFSCGISSGERLDMVAGEVHCWGTNKERQSTPYKQREWKVDGAWGKVVPQTTNARPRDDDAFVQISAGGHHACGVTKTGKIRCWGSDQFGQSSPPSLTVAKTDR